MSHTSSIKAIKIVSIDALRAAVEEMSKNGIRCSLSQNKAPRAYFNNQAGMGVAPYVLELPDAKYDIGFYPVEGGFEARTDFFGGSVERAIGVQACSVDTREQARMGKLFQAYGVHAAMEQARKQGYSVRRMPGTDGSEKLVVTGQFVA